MKKAHVLFFDLDGTLLDTVSDLGAAVNTILKKYNYPTHELDEYVNFIGRGSLYLIKTASGETDEEKINLIYKEYLANLLDNLYVRTTSYPYIASALEKFSLAGYELFVFTNKPQEAAEGLIKKFFKNVKFKAIIGQGQRKFPPKPDPTGLQEIISEYKIDPEDVIYFGDSNYDMIVANKCNIPYRIGCEYGYQDKERLLEGGATDIITSGKDYFKIVNKYGFSRSISVMVLFVLLQLTIMAIMLFMGITSSIPSISAICYALIGIDFAYTAVSVILTTTNIYYLEPHLLYCFTSSFISSILFTYLFSNAFITLNWNKVQIIIFICAIIFAIFFFLSLFTLIKNGIKDIQNGMRRKKNLHRLTND